jgi:hypothetical protein
VRFHPLQHRPDGGATYFSEVRLRLDFRDRPARAGAAPGPAQPVHASLANAGTAGRWPLQLAAPAAPKSPRTRALPLERLRLRIPQRGVYQLGYNDLKTAGVPVDDVGFDPRSLRLYLDSWRPLPLFADSVPASWQASWDMQQVDVWVDGETDGSFDLDDRLVFYALGPRGYLDLAGESSDLLAHFRHPYDSNQYAWLVWGDGEPGARMRTQSVAAPVAPPESLVTSARHRVHLEEDTQYDLIDDLWYWQEIRSGRTAVLNFDLDLAGAATGPGDLHVSLGYGGSTSGRHTVDVELNGVGLGRLDWVQIGYDPRVFALPGVWLRAVGNNLRLAIGPVVANDRVQLQKLDLVYQRPLVATSGLLTWSDLPPPAAGAPSQLPPRIWELAGFAAAPLVFDVSDWRRPVRLLDATGVDVAGSPRWRLRHGGAGDRAHYWATSAPARLEARDLVLRTVAPLRQRTSSPDMLIVTHGAESGQSLDLRAAAERLAAHRRAHFPAGGTPDIQVVTTRDIFENFSAGRQDPLAIRNYIKFLYQLEAPPRLAYVLLFGDGTNDPRQLLRGTVPTVVPALQAWYADRRFRQEYAVDDWLAELDTPTNNVGPDIGARWPVPDVAMGRLAPRNAADAQRLVDKLIAYETTSGWGTWRARAIMASDDECSPRSGCSERAHTVNSENLLAYLPSEFDVVKSYLTEYTATLGQKPQARTDFIREWSRGALLVNYQGHGAPRQLADEVLLLSSDIPALTNGSRLPIFLPISCTVGEFDEPEAQSMCEDLLSSSAGGAIAAIGATTPTYIDQNYQLNAEVFRQLFPGRRLQRVPIGVAHQIAKARAATGRNGESYILFGDPSMTLLGPETPVWFTAGADTLLAGRRARIVGGVYRDSVLQAGFDGQADVEVFGQADTTGYRSTNIFPISYDLVGSPIYRGTVPVQDGRFEFQFIVPLGVRLGGKGRVSAYAYGDAGDAKGARNTVRLRLGAGEDSSRAAPRITLRFPNQRTRVKAGTLLTAEIRDENGINIQGTSARNSILLDFDRRSEFLDVTDLFSYEAGSDSVGSVTVPLPSGLETGAHSATLVASDNLLNTTTASVDFELVEDEVIQLANVLAFPNPFRDRTHFFFEITDPAEVEVRVFTSSGREVWRRKQRFEAGIRGSIKWDGVDLQEDTLANGTYLYRLRARPDRPGAPTLEHVGKVVIMR